MRLVNDWLFSLLLNYSCGSSSGSECQRMFPDVFQHSIRIPARLSSVSGLFQDLSTIFQSLDPACNVGVMLLVCHYLHPPCTVESMERFNHLFM